jgi:hypothetical protein
MRDKWVKYSGNYKIDFNSVFKSEAFPEVKKLDSNA